MLLQVYRWVKIKLIWCAATVRMRQQRLWIDNGWNETEQPSWEGANNELRVDFYNDNAFKIYLLHIAIYTFYKSINNIIGSV